MKKCIFLFIACMFTLTCFGSSTHSDESPINTLVGGSLGVLLIGYIVSLFSYYSTWDLARFMRESSAKLENKVKGYSFSSAAFPNEIAGENPNKEVIRNGILFTVCIGISVFACWSVNFHGWIPLVLGLLVITQLGILIVVQISISSAYRSLNAANDAYKDECYKESVRAANEI